MLYHLSYIPFSLCVKKVHVSSALLIKGASSCVASVGTKSKMHPVGFEPTHLSIAVLETAPLDRSGTNALLSSLECVVVSRLGVDGVSCCVMLCHVVSIKEVREGV